MTGTERGVSTVKCLDDIKDERNQPYYDVSKHMWTRSSKKPQHTALIVSNSNALKIFDGTVFETTLL